MKSQTIISSAVAALLLTAVAHAQPTLVPTTSIGFLDIGTGAPQAGPLDISQFSTAGTGNDGQLNYYWDDGVGHQTGPDAGYPSQTFTTGANAAGYYVNSLSIKTDGNGGDTPTQPEIFALSFYQISGTGNTNATLITNYIAHGTLAHEGDWIQLYPGIPYNSPPLKLQPNTTYAWGFGITTNAPESWERIGSATGTGFNGAICLIDDLGGTVTYSTNASVSVATFDLGLQDASKSPTPPPAWTANSSATVETNEILWTLWGPGLTSSTGFAPAGGNNGFGEITPVFQGQADALYGAPTASFFTNILQGPFNNGTGLGYFGGTEANAQAYADQFLGVFIPPVTGNYVFWICSDDYSELYLSTDITAANAHLIAEENTWSNPDQWTTSSGGSSTAQKRSDQFVDPAATSPFPVNSKGIPLVAGWSYFIELVHENGNGGYNDSVTYTLSGAPAPVTGVDTIISNGTSSTLLGYVAQPPSYVNFTKNPVTHTVLDGSEAAYSVAIASDATPYVASFQWQTNGVNVTNADGTVANGQDFSYIVTTNDNGVTVQCLVTYPGATTNVYTSATATNVVVPSTLNVGGIKREFWANTGSIGSIASGNLPAITYAAAMTNWHSPVNTGINNYDQKVTGWFIPPTTGLYVFFVESDDNSRLFISTDSTPNNKYLIAEETQYANDYEWVTDQGGAAVAGSAQVAQKRSDQFIPPGGSGAPYGAGISLTAGKSYYIEGDMFQGGGGDNFAATFKLTTDPDPTNGQATAFAGSNLAFETSPSTNLTITANPFSTTVFEGGPASFSVTVATDSAIQPNFEWLLNGTNVGSGSVSNLTSTYTIGQATLADNDATLQCLVTIPFTTLATNSTSATLTVQKAVEVLGFLKMQYYPNTTLANVEAGEVGAPEYVTSLNNPETPVNSGLDNYVEVISGYFIPPETGNFTFYTTSDDQSDLFLSTDDTPGNLRLIAQENQWSNSGQWTTSSGGSSVTQKDSDTWSPNGTATPYAGGIPLKAGSNYFIQQVHYQGGGGDNSSIAFSTEDGNYTVPASGSPSDFQTTNMAMLAPPATVSIVSNPASATVLSGGPSVSFSALGTSDSLISVDDVTNVFVTYQWYTNGGAVPGAFGSTFTESSVPPSFNNQQVYCAISAIGAPTTNTTTAILTVITDTNPPSVLATASVYDSGGATSGELPNQFVDVVFSKAMDLSTLLNPANYAITGATITGVSLFTNSTGQGSSVMAILTLASPLTGNFKLTLTGVNDVSGIPVSNPSINGTANPLTSLDIGSIEAQGTTFFDGSTYEVDANGIDIWGTQDSFRYVYEPVTNDFDIAVQVTQVDPADQWTKAGLMARETIDPTDGGSRMIFGITTASTTESPKPVDGTTAQNGLSTGFRDAPDTGAFSGTAANGTYYFIGDGVVPPQYPGTWLRMTRQTGVTNDVFTFYGSTNDGASWLKISSWDPENDTNNLDATAFPSVIYIGMCTTAHVGEPSTLLGTGFYQHFGPYVAAAPEPVLSAVLASKTSITVSWSPPSAAALYSSPVLSTNTNSWTLVTTNNPATVPIVSGGPPLFFKLGP